MDRKYSILHLIESLGVAGAEIRLLEDVRHLGGFNHRVCYLFPEHSLKDRFNELSVRTDCLGVKNKHNPWDYLRGYQRLMRIIFEYKPDIIHSHLFYANILARLTTVFYWRAKYIQTIHCPDYEKKNDFLYSPWRHLTEFATFLIKRPKSIAVSEYVKKKSVETLGLKADKVTVIYNYLSEDWFAKKVNNNLSSGIKMVVSVGRLEKQKGFEYLIRATRIVINQGKKIRVDIAGEGTLRNSLTGLINKLNLKDYVFLSGKIKDVPEFLNKADIFIFPSLDEGLGISLIEAMSLGKICIASDVGPVPEIIQDNKDGFLVPPADPEALADKIRYCLDNEDIYEEVSNNARLKAQKKFSANNSVRLLTDYYNSVMKERHGCG